METRRLDKRKYHDYSEELLQIALTDIRRNKLSVRQAEEKYGISKSTLNRKINNKHLQKYGRPPVFSATEEAHISKCLSLAAKWGYPLTKRDLKEVIKKTLDGKGVTEKRFINNKPGKKWLKAFLARQQDLLKTRLSHNIKRARAGITPEVITEYFNELKESLKDIPPESIINYDETNMQDDPGKKKIIVHRHCKNPEQIKDTSKAGFSVMFAGSASGSTLPVYVVYKSATNLYHSWMEGGPKNARYNRSKSGWFEGPLFEDWFITVALPYLKKLGDGPKAIIGDNLASHVSIRVLELCIENNIKFLLLPPNSTHLCQPLDLAYFSPLKTAWRKLLDEYKSKHRGSIAKDIFPRKLKQVLEIIEKNSAQNLKSGFAASGIYPLDPYQVLKRLPQKDDTKENSEVWTNSFESFLKQQRQSETQTLRKRKKVTTAPGKSLSELDVVENIKKVRTEKKKNDVAAIPGPSNAPNLKVKKRLVKTKTLYDLSGSSEDEGHLSLHDTDSDVDMEDFSDFIEDRREQSKKKFRDNLNNNSDYMADMDAQTKESAEKIASEKPDGDKAILDKTEDISNPNSYDKTEQEKTESNVQLEIKDFVIVDLKYNEGTKKECTKEFVGRILKIDREQILLDFMRKYKGSHNVFVFPDIEDRLFVQRSQIKRVIKPVSNTRNTIFTFNDLVC